MLKIKCSQYNSVLSILSHEPIDIVHAKMVLEQKEDGEVYVDNERSPTSFLIIHNKSGFGILFGKNDNAEFNYEMKNLLLNADNKKKRIRLFVSEIPWKDTIERLLGNLLKYYEDVLNNNENIDKFVIGRERVKFNFNQQIFESNLTDFPEGFLIKRIDEKIIEKISGNVVPEFSWSTSNNFLKNGIGFCLIKDGEIVSTAFSAFISDDMIDIGIETAIDYRGKGLGFYPAAEMVKFCLCNGYQPVWGCRKDNLSSSRLAKKLGFIEVMSHPWYFSANS